MNLKMTENSQALIQIWKTAKKLDKMKEQEEK